MENILLNLEVPIQFIEDVLNGEASFFETPFLLVEALLTQLTWHFVKAALREDVAPAAKLGPEKFADCVAADCTPRCVLVAHSSVYRWLCRWRHAPVNLRSRQKKQNEASPEAGPHLLGGLFSAV